MERLAGEIGHELETNIRSWRGAGETRLICARGLLVGICAEKVMAVAASSIPGRSDRKSSW